MLLSPEKAGFVTVVSCTLHSMVWVQGNIADIHRTVNGVWDKYSWKRHNYTTITQTISCDTRCLLTVLWMFELWNWQCLTAK